MMPDIDHAEARTLANAALDGELDALTMIRFEAHLAGCSDCAADYAQLAELSVAIRARATRHAAPDALREALMESIFQSASPLEEEAGALRRVGGDAAAFGQSSDMRNQYNPPGNAKPLPTSPARGEVIALRRRLRPAAAGFAIGAALAASVAVLIDNRTVDDPITESIVTAHIRGLQPGHLTDIQISDQHQVKPWFDGKVDFAPPVKDLSDQGFDLVGGRLDYLKGHPAAVVVYRRKLHVIDLFVTRTDGKESPGDTLPAPQATPSGYNVVHWRDGGQEYWAVSDLNRAELADFAKAWLGRQ